MDLNDEFDEVNEDCPFTHSLRELVGFEIAHCEGSLADVLPYLDSWCEAMEAEMRLAIRWVVRHPESINIAPLRRAQATRPKRRPISGAVRIEVYQRDAYRCVKCNSWEDLTVDHIVPVIAGGDDSAENLQTLCRSCNSKKGITI